MTTFNAQQAGTSEQAWSECDWLREAAELEDPCGTRLVVVAAHPDDETLGAGGLIGFASDAGLDVYVIFASDGAASHPNSSTHLPAQLAALRKDEAVDAVRTLAPHATVEFLELPDGDLAAHGDAIIAALRAACGQDTTLLSPWAHDRHPDHEACARAARTVTASQPDIELLEFPIWAWHWGDPADQLAHQDAQTTATRRLALSAEACRRKQAAIACYPSQTEPLSPRHGDEAVLTRNSLAYFARNYECFFLVAPSRF